MNNATPKLLGPDDEPQNSGALVAVHYGDYRRQEIWTASGANVGCWYPLGGEFGRPKVWVDPCAGEPRFLGDPEPRPGPGEVPLHPDWRDVLARGPVTLLVGGDNESYLRGWRAGRRHLWQGMEDATYDDPREVFVE